MKVRETPKSEGLKGRLLNWKFGSAAALLDGQPSELADTVSALSRVFGNCGWFEGDLGLIVGSLVADMTADVPPETRVATCEREEEAPLFATAREMRELLRTYPIFTDEKKDYLAEWLKRRAALLARTGEDLLRFKAVLDDQPPFEDEQGTEAARRKGPTMKALRFTIYLDVFATAKDAQNAAASRLRQVASYLEQLPPEAVHRPLMAGAESGGITGHPVLVDHEMDDKAKVEAFAFVAAEEHWKAIWKVKERD